MLLPIRRLIPSINIALPISIDSFKSLIMSELKNEATPHLCKKFWALLIFFFYSSLTTQCLISFLKISLVLWMKLISKRIISNLYSYFILFESTWFIFTIDWITSSQPTTCNLSYTLNAYLSAESSLKWAKTSYRFLATSLWLYSLKTGLIYKNLTNFFLRLFITIFF